MTLYITPASLSENKSDENIHRRFRNEGLNREELCILNQAGVVIEDYHRDYNAERTYSLFGYLSQNASSWGNPDQPLAPRLPALRSGLLTTTDVFILVAK